jgi:hypothetical protein
MSTEEKLRVIESYKGRGKIYQGEQFIAEVNYSIKEVEQVIDPTLLVAGPTVEIAGQRNICGIIESPHAKHLFRYLGARLTLHFQDGRLLDFTVTQNPGKDTCLIQSLGSFRRMS